VSMLGALAAAILGVVLMIALLAIVDRIAR
jgi:hypothetical protein